MRKQSQCSSSGGVKSRTVAMLECLPRRRAPWRTRGTSGSQSPGLRSSLRGSYLCSRSWCEACHPDCSWEVSFALLLRLQTPAPQLRQKGRTRKSMTDLHQLRMKLVSQRNGVTRLYGKRPSLWSNEFMLWEVPTVSSRRCDERPWDRDVAKRRGSRWRIGSPRNAKRDYLRLFYN